MQDISTFMDGETGRREARQALKQLQIDGECGANWETFHLIGDVMRGDLPLCDDFATRLHARMAEEPTVFAPRFTWRKTANLGLSVAAALAAVSVITVGVLSPNPFAPQTQIAVAPEGQPNAVNGPTATPRPVAPNTKGKVNEYLMAHQEFSPSTTLQGVAPYIRTVSAAHDGND